MPKQVPSDQLDAALAAAAQFPAGGSIEDIGGALTNRMAHRTLQRRVARLVAEKRLIAEGSGRASRYRPSVGAHLVLPALTLQASEEAYIPISPEAEAISGTVIDVGCFAQQGGPVPAKPATGILGEKA